MNCVDFRRKRLTGLRAEPGELSAHTETCPDCARFSREIETLDQAIDTAARVPVPTELVDRILLDQRLRTRRRFLGVAVAASAAGVAAVGGVAGWWRSGQVAEIALDHTTSFPKEAERNQAVALGQLVQAFADWDGKLKGPLGEVSFLGKCPMRGGITRHMILRTAQGMAHVILMPQAVAGRESARRDGMISVAVPAGSGSLVIVAGNEAAVAGIERLITQQVQWS
jgi:hypothetical protein